MIATPTVFVLGAGASGGREELNYATASGDELRLFFEWKGTRR
jgi:hypothetical protein